MLHKLDRSLLLKGEIEPSAKNALNEASKSSDSTSEQSFGSYFSEPQNKPLTKPSNQSPKHSEDALGEETPQTLQQSPKSEFLKSHLESNEGNVEDATARTQLLSDGVVIQSSSDTDKGFSTSVPENFGSSLSDESNIGFFELMVSMKEVSLEQDKPISSQLDTPAADEQLVELAADSQQEQIAVNELLQQSGAIEEDSDETPNILNLQANAPLASDVEGEVTLAATALEETAVTIDETNSETAEQTPLHPDVEAFLMTVSAEVSATVNDTMSVEETDLNGNVDAIHSMDDLELAKLTLTPLMQQLQQSVNKLNQAYQSANPETQAAIAKQMHRLLGPQTIKDGAPLIAPSIEWSESELPLKIDVQQVIKEIMAMQTQAKQADGNQMIPLTGALGQLIREHQNASDRLEASSQLLSEEGVTAKNVALTSNTQLTRAPSDVATNVLHLQRSDAHKKLAETVSVMINQRHLLADIRLDPADLGMMQIKVNMQGEQAHISFVVQSQQTQQLMEQSIQRLRELLINQGVDVGDTFVSHDEQAFENQQQEGGDANGELASESEQAEDETSEVAVQVVDDGRIDDFA